MFNIGRKSSNIDDSLRESHRSEELHVALEPVVSSQGHADFIQKKRRKPPALCRPCVRCIAGNNEPKSDLPRNLSTDEQEQLAKVCSLSQKEVLALYQRFRKVAWPNKTMSIEQFRGTLGILGLSQNTFLSDALYRVFTGGDDDLTYVQFIQHLAIMLRGSEDEKLALSFNLSLTSEGINEDGSSSHVDDPTRKYIDGRSVIKQDSKTKEESAAAGSKETGMLGKLKSKLTSTGLANNRKNMSKDVDDSTTLKRSGSLNVGKAGIELNKRINLAEVRGIRIEQFRELIRAIDLTTNSLLPANYQKEISEEQIEALFYHIAANEFYNEPRNGMAPLAAVNVPKVPQEEEDKESIETKDSTTFPRRTLTGLNALFSPNSGTTRGAKGSSGSPHANKHKSDKSEHDIRETDEIPKNKSDRAEGNRFAKNRELGVPGIGRASFTSGTRRSKSTYGLLQKSGGMSPASLKRQSPTGTPLVDAAGGNQSCSAHQSGSDSQRTSPKSRKRSKDQTVITLTAYKNAVRNSPEFLELIGLLPPTKSMAPPPKTFQHHNRVFKITKPPEFWNALFMLRDELQRQAASKNGNKDGSKELPTRANAMSKDYSSKTSEDNTASEFSISTQISQSSRADATGLKTALSTIAEDGDGRGETSGSAENGAQNGSPTNVTQSESEIAGQSVPAPVTVPGVGATGSSSAPGSNSTDKGFNFDPKSLVPGKEEGFGPTEQGSEDEPRKQSSEDAVTLNCVDLDVSDIPDDESILNSPSGGDSSPKRPLGADSDPKATTLGVDEAVKKPKMSRRASFGDTSPNSGNMLVEVVAVSLQQQRSLESTSSGGPVERTNSGTSPEKRLEQQLEKMFSLIECVTTDHPLDAFPPTLPASRVPMPKNIARRGKRTNSSVGLKLEDLFAPRPLEYFGGGFSKDDSAIFLRSNLNLSQKLPPGRKSPRSGTNTKTDEKKQTKESYRDFSIDHSGKGFSNSAKDDRKKSKSHKILGPKKGMAVHFGHENWNMVVNMMIGIRMAVGRASNELDRSVQTLDFRMQDKFAILPNLANIMDSVAGEKQNYTVFVDYAPFVFRKIRDLRGIDPEGYLRSVGPEQLLGNMILGNLSSLSELSSEGKSGAFFYYTADGNFMIKTVTKEEKDLLHNMLPNYWCHIKKYPNNLIIKFFGLHALRVRKEDKYGIISEKKIYFVIMGNMFNTPFEIHRRYDLKGSSIGRATPAHKKRDRTLAQKDLDFLSDGMSVPVGKRGYKIICNQLEKDAYFLARNNIIDYSVLLGIHHVAKEEVDDFKEALEDMRIQKERAERQRQALTRSTMRARIGGNLASPTSTAAAKGGGFSPTFSGNSKVGNLISMTNRGSVATSASNLAALGPNNIRSGTVDVPYHEQHFGGLASADKDNPTLFFIGVIDILTNYGWFKKVEHNAKSCLYPTKWRGISCCPPKMYAERFVSFMRERVFCVSPDDLNNSRAGSRGMMGNLRSMVEFPLSPIKRDKKQLEKPYMGAKSNSMDDLMMMRDPDVEANNVD